MKWIKKISVLFLTCLYLLSATGVVVYQAHCLCTGNQNVSLYVSPDPCDISYHTHHVHIQVGEEVSSSENECPECTSHTNGCGCDNLSISFHKLKNEVVFEKARSKPIIYVAAFLSNMEVSLLASAKNDAEESETKYIEPPSSHTALDFLITIHQLKIPYKA